MAGVLAECPVYRRKRASVNFKTGGEIDATPARKMLEDADGLQSINGL
jgi:hypothetical protein